MDPQDPASTLFTRDATAESMERESLDIGIASVLEDQDHAMGALHGVVVPSGQVWFGPASCPFFLYILFVS